jgi:hypothetical protein
MGRQELRHIATSQILRPQRNLWSSAWIACLAFTLPVFLSFYVITVPTGRWVPFAMAQAVLMLLFAGAVARLKGAGVHLSAEGIRERAYFSRAVFTPVEAVSSVLVVKLRDSYSDTMSRQLFVLDARGNTLLRLRGQLWHRADLQRVVHFYAVPVLIVETPLTWPELRRSYGRNLAAWERHPFLTTAALVIAFLVVAFSLLHLVLGASAP